MTTSRKEKAFLDSFANRAGHLAKEKDLCRACEISDERLRRDAAEVRRLPTKPHVSLPVLERLMPWHTRRDGVYASLPGSAARHVLSTRRSRSSFASKGKSGAAQHSPCAFCCLNGLVSVPALQGISGTSSSEGEHEHE